MPKQIFNNSSLSLVQKNLDINNSFEKILGPADFVAQETNATVKATRQERKYDSGVIGKT
jgi:hypothetical protein